MCEQEQSLKLFDVLNFDVIHFARLDFAPGECCFVSKVASFSPILAVAQIPQQAEDGESGDDLLRQEGVIRLVKVEQVSTKLDQNQAIQSMALKELHDS